jgi:hypothetical protein
VADEDYIAARLAFRSGLPHPSLWQSQQAIEKYLKCILLLHRIPAKKVMHSLRKAFDLIQASGKISLDIKSISMDFLNEIDEIGTFRYFEISLAWTTKSLFLLDRLVWELRRYCTLDKSYAGTKLIQGKIPSRYSLEGGRLEEIADSKSHPAREHLLWKNGYFGKRKRRLLTFRNTVSIHNAPLYMHPELLDDLTPLVYLPERLIKEWRQHKAPGYTVPPDVP